MSVNPDRTAGLYKGIAPNPGDLRFLKRTDYTHPTHPQTERILQRYEWSYEDGKWDWYDVIEVDATGSDEIGHGDQQEP